MKVPADLDQLMWFLAESGDLAAIAEFRKRFPDLEPELLRRQSVVRGLKGAKPAGAAAPVGFELRENVVEYGKPANRLVWALGGAAIVALGVASYVVTARMTAQPMAKTETPVATTGNARPDAPGSDFDSGVRPTVITPEPVPDQKSALGPGDTPPVRENRALWERPQSIMLEEAPLYDVLQSIANQTGMSLEIAPNTPNPTVSISFENVSGFEMLTELGKAHGFTPLEQGGGKWLIVPAVQWTDPSP
jgi:hypothetical protein